MLNKNLTGFVQSHFSVQSICTIRKGSASRVFFLKRSSKISLKHSVFVTFFQGMIKHGKG